MVVPSAQRLDAPRIAAASRIVIEQRQEGMPFARRTHQWFRGVVGGTLATWSTLAGSALDPEEATVYEDDYILRVIDQMGILLRAMLNEVRLNKTEQVYKTSQDSLQLLLGLPTSVAETLTADGYVAMLSVGGGFDTKRGRLTAEVLLRRAQAAELAGEHERSVAERVKAERLITLVLADGDDDDRAEAAALAAELAELP